MTRPLTALAVFAALAAAPARAQSLPPGVAADTLRISGSVAGAAVEAPLALGVGDRVVVVVERDVEVGNSDAGGRPVPDAPPGAVVARFGAGPPFAWPDRPTVWTAPRAGRLAFGLNGTAAHALAGEARVVVTRLDAAARAAFPAPAIRLERVDGGIRVGWTDRAGYGIDERTLSFRLTTAHGTVYDLGAWGPVETGGALLPLPPPVSLPPGIHVLSATVTDHLGNPASRSTVTFHTGG